MTDRRTDQERELDRWARRDERRPPGRVSAPRGWSAAESREIVPALRRRFDRLPWVEAACDPEWREQTLRDLLCRPGLDLGRICDALGEGLAARDEAARAAGPQPAPGGAAALSRRRQDPPPPWIGHAHSKLREAGATRAQASALLHGLGLLPLDRGRPAASR